VFERERVKESFCTVYRKNYINEQTFEFEIKTMNKCCVCGIEPQSVDHSKHVECESTMSFCTAYYNKHFKRSMLSISQIEVHDKRL